MISNASTLARSLAHECALEAIEAGIAAAHPRAVIGDRIAIQDDLLRIGSTSYPLGGVDRLFVIGGGKAAGTVARELETALGRRIDDGIVVTTESVETAVVEVATGTHPLPSQANVEGTNRVLDLAATTTADDLVLVAVTGGGSALLCAPAAALSVQEYRDLTRQLLHSGATIDELNAVRKHLSRVKGGQLARELAPARCVGIVFSDVVGNPLDVVASGPTAPDPTTYEDAIAVLERYDVDPTDSVLDVLEAGVRGDRPETPATEKRCFERVTNHVLADNQTAIDAAATVCAERGYTPVTLSTRIEGRARDAGRMHVAIARDCLENGDPFEPPVALLSGGETTIVVTGAGQGGPNQEFCLAGAIDLATASDFPDDVDRATGLVVASVDTDGIDGASDAAGALVDASSVSSDSLPAARDALDTNNVSPFLEDRDCLVSTGPTGTNVNDLRMLLVGTP